LFTLDRGLFPISQGGEPVIGGRGPIPRRGVPVSSRVGAVQPGSPTQLPCALQFDQDGIEKPADHRPVSRQHRSPLRISFAGLDAAQMLAKLFAGLMDPTRKLLHPVTDIQIASSGYHVTLVCPLVPAHGHFVTARSRLVPIACTIVSSLGVAIDNSHDCPPRVEVPVPRTGR
jgi:hypothetical protein